MKPELLMPAGDFEKAKIAYQFGADACYGSTSNFSMRTREIGFNYLSLKKAVDYAHSIDKRFYVTINVFPREFEIANIKKHINKIISLSPDAIIVADLGVLSVAKSMIKKSQLNIDIHLSTQANATNSEAIKMWAKLGVSRIILPRELSLKEISQIRKNTPKQIKLEVFVHGAMCNSVSGRCNLSNYLSYRDANRGVCVQPCRWKYALVEEKRPNQFMPIDEDEFGSHLFNSRDLCMIEHLDKLKKAGIGSFKIEGRNKSIYYVAIVARAYRHAVDFSPNNVTIEQLNNELLTLSNRGYSTGFYFGRPTENDIDYKTSRPKSDWKFIGIVKSKIDGNYHGSFSRDKHGYLIEVRNEILSKTDIEIVTPDKIYRTKMDNLLSVDGERPKKANPNDIIILESKNILPINSMIRAKISSCS